MKFILAIICLISAQPIFAQIKPNFFPEDISSEGVEVRCFCKPGIRNKSRSKGLEISYALLGSGTFEPEEGGFTAPYSQYKNWRQVEVNLKAPIINKDNFKLVLGYKYRTESFDISQVGVDFSDTFRGLNGSNLKTNSLSVTLAKPLNETQYIVARLGYTANGNYSGAIDFGSRYAIYRGMAMFGVKPNEDLEWGIGVGYSQSFRRTTVVPFLLYNRNLNERWGIESGFPGYVFGRYNINTKNILLFGVEYNSQSYRFDVSLPNDDQLNYALNHSELIGLLRLERQIAPWIWGNAKAGYQLNFSSDFESKSVNTTPFQVEPNDGIFLQIGIFISPPDSFLSGR